MSSIDAGWVPWRTTLCSCGMAGVLAGPGSSSMYFSPSSPRLATCALAPGWSITSGSMSSVTSAFPSGRSLIFETFPARTPATRTADLLSSPATESNIAVTLRAPVPWPICTSSIFRTKCPRIARITSMKAPTLAADDISLASFVGFRRIEPCPSQHLEEQSKRQSNYVRVAAVDGVDEHAAKALRGVGAGFVERLAGGDIPRDVALVERQHPHFRLRHARVAPAAGGVLERDAGVDGVRLAGDGGEHAPRVGVVGRLLQQFVAEKDGGVGGDDPGIAVFRRDDGGFVARQAGHVLLRRFAGLPHLGNVARHDVERKSDRRQQLAPPRRLRSEDEPHRAITRPMFNTTMNRASVTMR